MLQEFDYYVMHTSRFLGITCTSMFHLGQICQTIGGTKRWRKVDQNVTWNIPFMLKLKQPNGNLAQYVYNVDEVM